MKTYFRSFTSRGFTLRENLLALTIMVVSVALIVPVLAVMNDSCELRDRSNAQQIIAFCEYAHANGALISTAGDVQVTLRHLAAGVPCRSAQGARVWYQLRGYTADDLLRAERFLGVSNDALIYLPHGVKYLG